MAASHYFGVLRCQSQKNTQPYKQKGDLKMTRLTTIQKAGLNNMNVDAQRGSLGTRIDNLEYGGMTTPAAGTLSPANIILYESAPALGTNTYCMAAVALAIAAQTITTGITNPDVPRLLLIKGIAGGQNKTVTIYGTNAAGVVIHEDFTENGASAVNGTKAFATITSVVLPAYNNGTSDTVSVGMQNLIGYTCAIPATALVLGSYFNGSTDAGSTTAAATVEGSYYTAVTPTNYNGVKKLDLYYIAAR